jgi:hypothetical protein
MNRYLALLIVTLATFPGVARGQDLLYDQISGPDTLIVYGASAVGNRLTQSFTPGLAGIGFVQLQAVVYPEGGSILSRVILRRVGLNGPVLASTDPLFIEDNSLAVRTYYFQGNIPVTPDQMYWLDIELVSLASPAVGMSFQDLYPSSYPRGDLYANGFLNPSFDFWFREGIVVPEPAALSLLLLGVIALHGWRYCRRVRCTGLPFRCPTNRSSEQPLRL